MADCCDDKKVFVVVGPDGFGGYYIRIFGLGKNGEGPVGLWQLLDQDEAASLGLDIYRFQPGGIKWDNESSRESVQAIAVRVWRHLKPDAGYPNVVFL